MPNSVQPLAVQYYEGAGCSGPRQIVPGTIALFGLCLTAVLFHQVIIITTGLERNFDNFIFGLWLVALPGIGVILYSSQFRFRPVLAQLYLSLAILPLGGLAFRDMGHTVHYLARTEPLWDHRLAFFDAALGFDWLAMLAWADQHPLAATVGHVAYISFSVQMVIVPVLVATSRRSDRLLTLLTANVVALILVHAIASFIPAVGAYQFYGVDPSRHPNIHVMVADLPGFEILGMRDGTILNVSRGFPMGLIAFPSYHATGAILFIWALWRVSYARYAGLTLNGSMLMATPLHGSHYLVDVIAGCVVAVIALWLATSAQGLANRLYMQVASFGSSPNAIRSEPIQTSAN